MTTTTEEILEACRLAEAARRDMPDRNVAVTYRYLNGDEVAEATWRGSRARAIALAAAALDAITLESWVLGGPDPLVYREQIGKPGGIGDGWCFTPPGLVDSLNGRPITVSSEAMVLLGAGLADGREQKALVDLWAHDIDEPELAERDPDGRLTDGVFAQWFRRLNEAADAMEDWYVEPDLPPKAAELLRLLEKCYPTPQAETHRIDIGRDGRLQVIVRTEGCGYLPLSFDKADLRKSPAELMPEIERLIGILEEGHRINQAAISTGFDVGDMAQGELELTLHIDDHNGRCFLSREMWEVMGAAGGWLDCPPQETSPGAQPGDDEANRAESACSAETILTGPEALTFDLDDLDFDFEVWIEGSDDAGTQAAQIARSGEAGVVGEGKTRSGALRDALQKLAEAEL
jgi:hypothetical protein